MRKINIKSGPARGVALGLLSAMIGGVCPIYWRQIASINSIVILFYRVALVCVFSFIFCLIVFKWEGLIAPLKRKGAIRRFTVTGIIMVSNWGIFVWAINAGYIVQTSIGYFIVPILVCLIGMYVFHERVERHKVVGIIIVAVGTVALVIAYGELPTVAIGVALTYSIYTSVQKTSNISGVQAMFYQTLFLMPFFVIAILYVELTGQGAYASASGFQLFLLSFAGIVTALPLILVLDGINYAPLVVMGLTSYVGDFLMLLIGVFVYSEKISPSQFFAMSIIWAGIAFFTLGGIAKIDYIRKKKITED